MISTPAMVMDEQWMVQTVLNLIRFDPWHNTTMKREGIELTRQSLDENLHG